MKRVVLSENLKEFEIHPPKLFDKYRDITKNELQLYIKKWDLFDIDCPACNSKQKKIVFNKFGMNYAECKNCKTLYVTPRPSDNEISEYYRTSKAMSFWNDHFYKDTILDRKKIVFKSRALWIVSLTEKYFKKPKQFIDIKSKYHEFIGEINNFDIFQNKIILDPLININASTNGYKAIKVINQHIETVSSKGFNANAITAFEVIDRISNPRGLIQKTRSMLVEDGLLFLTMPTISGFDLQILWDHSKSIFPIDHMNLFSIEGIKELINNCGFKIIELSTPGQLDIEIVKNAMITHPDLKIPRFVSYLIENRDENAHRSFQDFLQMYGLSSHVRIASQK